MADFNIYQSILVYFYLLQALLFHSFGVKLAVMALWTITAQENYRVMNTFPVLEPRRTM